MAQTEAAAPRRDDVAGAALEPLPAWLGAARRDVFASGTWREMTERVSAEIKPMLARRNVQYFSDLNEHEKGAMIGEVERMMRERSVGLYGEFLSTLTSSINQRLSDDVARALRAEDNTQTHVDLLMSRSAEACGTILHRIPRDNKAGLRLMLNEAFPSSLRPSAWKLFLAAPSSRLEYEERVSKRRMDTISAEDVFITNRCQALLDLCAPSIAGDSATVLAMKTMLSYRHCLMPFDEELYYRLAVPLVLAYDVRGVSAIVEGYEALMELPRPRYLLRPADKAEKQATRAAVSLARDCLDKLPQLEQLMKHIAVVYAGAEDESGGNEASQQLRLLSFLEPCFEFCFVGVLNEQALLYVWDSCIMAGFDKLVPRFAACLVLQMEDQLMQCQTPNVLAQVVREQARSVSVRSLQLAMDRHFVDDIFRETGAGVRREAPSASAGLSALSQSLFEAEEAERGAPPAPSPSSSESGLLGRIVDAVWGDSSSSDDSDDEYKALRAEGKRDEAKAYKAQKRKKAEKPAQRRWGRLRKAVASADSELKGASGDAAAAAAAAAGGPAGDAAGDAKSPSVSATATAARAFGRSKKEKKK